MKSMVLNLALMHRYDLKRIVQSTSFFPFFTNKPWWEVGIRVTSGIPLNRAKENKTSKNFSNNIFHISIIYFEYVCI